MASHPFPTLFVEGSAEGLSKELHAAAAVLGYLRPVLHVVLIASDTSQHTCLLM
jgi:hypothetical protein